MPRLRPVWSSYNIKLRTWRSEWQILLILLEILVCRGQAELLNRLWMPSRAHWLQHLDTMTSEYPTCYALIRYNLPTSCKPTMRPLTNSIKCWFKDQSQVCVQQILSNSNHFFWVLNCICQWVSCICTVHMRYFGVLRFLFLLYCTWFRVWFPQCNATCEYMPRTVNTSTGSPLINATLILLLPVYSLSYIYIFTHI